MPVTTQTFPPAPGGMNTAQSGQEIDDTEAGYLQDILVDRPGIARRRGPLSFAAGWAALPRKATGLAISIDPNGDDRYAALTGDISNGYLTIWSPDKSSTIDVSWPHALPTDPEGAAATAYRLHSAVPALGGGTWIGTASDYGAGDSLQALGLWKGGNSVAYATGTITLTRGSPVVTGSGTSWLTTATPGMFLFADTDDSGAGTFTLALIGIVKTVTSNTALDLEKASPYTGSAGRPYSLTSVRGFLPQVSKGRITCATTSTTVSGGSTKFSGQISALGGTWNLYRSADGTWIGKVASVESDISLTLAANAAVALADEPYYAIRGDWSVPEKSVEITESDMKTGWLTGIYAERQWYLNNGKDFEKTYRMWFSDVANAESVDLSTDGDWIPISSTSDIPEPARAMVPTYNAMLVMKESETFAVYGNSPSSFSSKKLEDDGTLSSMSVQPFGGGAIWAGRNGIYYYDGVQVTNMAQAKLGDAWKNTAASIDPLRYRMWSMILRNHYYLFIENLDPAIPVIKGNTATTPDHWVVVINMESRAFALHTNLKMRGAVTLPAAAGRGVMLVANTVADNLVVNPDFETDTTGWTDGAAYAIAADTAVAKFGTKSLKATRDAMGSSDDDMATAPITAPAAGNYTASAWVWVPAAFVVGDSGTVNISLVNFTSATSVSEVSANLALRDQWQRISHTYTLDAGDLVGDVSLNAGTDGTNPVDTSFLYWDGVRVEAGEAAKPFFVGDNSSKGYVFDADRMFTAEGIDDVACDAGLQGPDFYFLSKKYNAGNDVQLKRFKQFAVHYLAQGSALNLDAVLGLNNVGQTLTGSFPSTVLTWDALRNLLPNWSAVGEEYPSWDGLIEGVFLPKRLRFIKKTHHLAFRLWQADGNMTRCRIGPFHIGYKLQRPQRVT